MQWIEQHSVLLFAFSFLWVVACAAFFAWRCHRSGPMYPAFTPTDIRFSEKYVSGASDKNFVARFGGARNALAVTVLKDALIVEPIGIFKWLMPPGFNDLEHYVPRTNILSVQPVSAFGRSAVRIKVRGRDGITRTLQLMLRKHAEFLSALDS